MGVLSDSFRSRLAVNTLALGYPVRCYLRPLETLTPDTGHAWHTKKRARPFGRTLLSISPRVRRLSYKTPYGSSIVAIVWGVPVLLTRPTTPILSTVTAGFDSSTAGVSALSGTAAVIVCT